jgi:hypothetical protein
MPDYDLPVYLINYRHLLGIRKSGKNWRPGHKRSGAVPGKVVIHCPISISQDSGQDFCDYTA